MISAPEDYGLPPMATLAHVVSDPSPEAFEEFWTDFREAIESHPATIQGSTTDPVNKIMFESVRSVRISGRLSIPSVTPHGAVITSHGYSEVPDDFPEEEEPWISENLAVLRIRVRGYPPSVMDCDDMRSDWILKNIEVPDAWILRGAIGDLVQGYRCLRGRFGKNFPIAIHGESFGGGLAVIAAAQLSKLNDPPFRLALGLPSFGDWKWRTAHYCNGAGEQINRLVETFIDESEEFVENLMLFDAAIHACDVSCPTLCKLALFDDTVPAPTAAAIYNNLGSDEKWRFIVKYGHFDGGIANARRHAIFEQLHTQFVNPTNKPAEHIGSFSHPLEITD